MSADLKGVRIKPGDINADKWDEVVLCIDHNCPAGRILKASGTTGNMLEVTQADSLPPILGQFSLPTLYLSKTATTGNSGRMLVTRYGVISTPVSLAASVGDPIYLSQTPGLFDLAPTGQYRIIGTVIEVGTQGKILFDGSAKMPGYLNGVAEVSAAASVVISLPELGVNIGELIAGACCQNVDGAAMVQAVEISGAPSLTIHFTEAFTGSVGYWVFLGGIPPILP